MRTLACFVHWERIFATEIHGWWHQGAGEMSIVSCKQGVWFGLLGHEAFFLEFWWLGAGLAWALDLLICLKLNRSKLYSSLSLAYFHRSICSLDVKVHTVHHLLMSFAHHFTSSAQLADLGAPPTAESVGDKLLRMSGWETQRWAGGHRWHQRAHTEQVTG